MHRKAFSQVEHKFACKSIQEKKGNTLALAAVLLTEKAAGAFRPALHTGPGSFLTPKATLAKLKEKLRGKCIAVCESEPSGTIQLGKEMLH